MIYLLFIYLFCFCESLSTSKFASTQKHSIKNYLKNQNKKKIIKIYLLFFYFCDNYDYFIFVLIFKITF